MAAKVRTFAQGSPVGEACREADETQFSHTLVRHLAVTETQLTRRMWVALRARQPAFPPDPSVDDQGVGAARTTRSST